ncbi:hypothetical protein J7M22_10165, partial [Candidatus Poribacteria bacterium]|nr:hypothetical protein [Candidatus Poribacteria bacterium]
MLISQGEKERGTRTEKRYNVKRATDFPSPRFSSWITAALREIRAYRLYQKFPPRETVAVSSQMIMLPKGECRSNDNV